MLESPASLHRFLDLHGTILVTESCAIRRKPSFPYFTLARAKKVAEDQSDKLLAIGEIIIFQVASVNKNLGALFGFNV